MKRLIKVFAGGYVLMITMIGANPFYPNIPPSCEGSPRNQHYGDLTSARSAR
jgi:hypothetical protein